MEELAKRIKDLRKERNLSTKELGKILEVNDSTITRWENGKMIPSCEHLLNMAIYFKVSADYLLGLED